MKIIVATNKGGLEDGVSPVLGRCQTFTIVEVEGNEIKNVEITPNQFASAVHGAGIQAGQWIVSQKAKAVIAGNFGPNVTVILQQAGVEMVVAQGKVKDVVEKYLKGELRGNIASPSQPMQPYTPPTYPTASSPLYPPYYLPHPPYYPPYGWSFPPIQMQMSKEDKIKMIEEELKRIEDLLSAIKKRLEELKE